MQETQDMWIQSLGQEDLLEEEMATHSSISAWRIPQSEEPGRLQPMGLQRVGHNWAHTANTTTQNSVIRNQHIHNQDIPKDSELLNHTHKDPNMKLDSSIIEDTCCCR